MNSPMASPRSLRGKASYMMDMATPMSGPTPMPWTMRKKISELMSQAMEHRNEPSPKVAALNMNRLRSPMRCPSQPTLGMSTVRVIMNAISTHWIRSSDVPRDDIMAGMAVSMPVMPRPTPIIPSERVMVMGHFWAGS